MDKQILDDMDENVTELQAFFERIYSRWSEALQRGRKRRIPGPSMNKFWDYLGQNSATGNAWVSGTREHMSLAKVVEVAVRIWDIDAQGGILRAADAEELFRINGYDPVAPIRDARLRQIVLDYWDRLDYEDREELADYAERLASRTVGGPDATGDQGHGASNVGGLPDDVDQGLAKPVIESSLDGMAEGAASAQRAQGQIVHPE